MTDTPNAPVPADEIRQVQSISWPRSGHHLAVRLLQSYFGPQMGYCEYHRAEKPSVEGIKTCCKTVPCTFDSRGVHMAKNHDFDLDVPQITGLPYFIQYRGFVPSVVSNFELFVRTGKPDTAESFRQFASSQFTRYLDFTEKWVTSDFGQTQLVLHYDDLTADPESGLAKMVRWMAPEHTPDQTRIAKVVREVDAMTIEKSKSKKQAGAGVHSGRNVRDFRFYSEPMFDALENLHLRREDVVETFLRILGRKPGEPNMLRLQCHTDLAELEMMLRASDEFKNHHASTPK